MSTSGSEGAVCGPFTRYALTLQGYSNLTDAQKKRYEWPLRFTPATCAVLVIVGTVLQWPAWQFVLAGIALVGALFARGNPVDAVYNYGIRLILKAPMLSGNPRPRRFACLIVALMLTGSGLGFVYGLPVLGVVFGGALAAVLGFNASTNWCLGAWMYRLLRLPA